MKKRHLLLSAVSSLMVAVLALTAGTFAWFEFSLTPSVESFDLNMVSGDALQIAVINEAGAFGNVVLKEDFYTYAAATKAFPGKLGSGTDPNDYKLNAATPDYSGVNGTSLALTGNALTFYTHKEGRTYTDYTNKADSIVSGATGLLEAATPGNNYINVKVYFRANQSMKVFADVSALFTQAATHTPSIMDSLRVAFISSKAADYSAPSVAVYADLSSGSVDANSKLSNYQLQYVQKVDEHGDLVAGQYWADTKYNNYTRATVVDNKIELFSFTVTSGEAISEVWEVNIYIWAEGFDKDNNLEVTAQSFTTSLKFLGEKIV